MKQNKKIISAIRGMNDILPDEISIWQRIEALAYRIFQQYHYQEIRFPMVEQTQLFSRTVGEDTDIVSKEMYTFIDRNQDSLSLRPEGTAGCLRACIQHGLIYNNIQRLWYQGPMFRHERPQKGRYRQFYQIGAEAYGLNSPAIDVELILLNARLWKALDLNHDIHLQINTLGSLTSRQRYRKILLEYFNKHKALLDNDSKRRLFTNPLRILDSKNAEMTDLINQAPKLLDYLDDDAMCHFEGVCQLLKKMKIPYTVNAHLVRGLDYYNDTVFEWTTSALGAQGTVSAGGRYDTLIESLGGQPTPAVGFALGLERLVLLLKTKQTHSQNSPHVFLIATDCKFHPHLLQLAENLHNALPKLNVYTHLLSGKLKRQFKHADKSGARFALILGEDEIHNNLISLKDLRQSSLQKQFSFNALIEFLQHHFQEEDLL
jgi:histidyl-tRNA synthetase